MSDDVMETIEEQGTGYQAKKWIKGPGGRWVDATHINHTPSDQILAEIDQLTDRMNRLMDTVTQPVGGMEVRKTSVGKCSRPHGITSKKKHDQR